MAYGEDHFCGLFIQIFKRSEREEDPLINLDQFTDKLTPARMVAVAEEYGFVLE